MKLIFLSLDSGTDAQCAALWNEVERTLGFSGDPLDLLIEDEESWDSQDTEIAVILLNQIHRRSHGRGCSFPQCYKPCAGCNSCAHRERTAR
jgi:hypothetical protein